MIPLTLLPAEEQLAFLRSEVARLEEALEAMGGDLLETRAKLEAKHLDWTIAETARRVALQQRGDQMLVADLLRDKLKKLRAALVAVGPLLPTCACGLSGSKCRRCQALRQRAEALGVEDGAGC
jgi:hypothetical protein